MKLGAKMMLAPALLTAVALTAGLTYGWVDHRAGQRQAEDAMAGKHS
jgi:hypothetical protein